MRRRRLWRGVAFALQGKSWRMLEIRSTAVDLALRVLCLYLVEKNAEKMREAAKRCPTLAQEP